MIAFSTEAGETADDNPNEKNSNYCKYVSRNLLKKNIMIETVFKNVRAELRVLEQYPIEENRLLGNLILNYDPDPSINFEDIENTQFYPNSLCLRPNIYTIILTNTPGYIGSNPHI